MVDANSRTTYTTTANDRDVTNYVTNVSPKDTPFFTRLGNTTGMSRKVESVTDANAAANASNALVEGASLTTNTTTNDRTIIGNWMQIFTKTIEVSRTQEKVMKYGGITSEAAYQVKKAFKELAQDVEKALIVGTSATGTSAAARKLSGALEVITTNALTAYATAAVWVGTADADYNAFEEKLNDLFQLAYENGELMNHVFVAGKLKRRISKLNQRNQRNVNADDKMQVLTVQVYEGDFGEVAIVLDRYVPDTSVLAVAIEGWRVAYLDRFQQIELAKTTDGRQISIVGEMTLKYDSELFGGKITAS
jgi:hypothetical protein